MSEPARRDAVRIAARAVDVVDRRAQTRPRRAGEGPGRRRSRDSTRVPLRLVATGGRLIPQVPAEPADPELVRVRRSVARRADPPADPRQLASANPIRLTRRGRIAVTGAAALAIGAMTMILAGAANATAPANASGVANATAPANATGAPPASRGGVTKVVIRPGQSLWSVAESQDPNADPRVVIQQILQLNSLRTDQVRPGQVLWVPRG